MLKIMQGGGGAGTKGQPSAAHHLGSHTKSMPGAREAMCAGMCKITDSTGCVSFKQLLGDDICHQNKQIQSAKKMQHWWCFLGHLLQTMFELALHF